MGLDMFLYKVKKVGKEEAFLTHGTEIPETGADEIVFYHEWY